MHLLFLIILRLKINNIFKKISIYIFLLDNSNWTRKTKTQFGDFFGDMSETKQRNSTLAILACLLFILHISVVKCESPQEKLKEKYVFAMVNAKWSETPFLLEASEYIYRNSPKNFWLFLNEVQANSYYFGDVNLQQDQPCNKK